MISQILIVMIAAIAVTIFAERRNIQPPLLLALAGLLASFIPGLSRLELDPEIILTVVLPPLLFSAATEFSFVAFLKRLGSIVNLGVILVAVTTGVVASVASAAVPGMSIAVALVLGAVISPPDAVTAVAVGRRLGLPDRMMTVLKGESLINDAAALTLFTFATARVAGTPLFINSLPLFLAYSAVAGVVIGVVIGVIVHRTRVRLTNASLATVLTVLVPFTAYILAEELGASGVLAVVAAGFSLGHNSSENDYASRIQERQFWRTADALLEAFVFAYIGLQLRFVVEDVLDKSVSPFALLGISLVVLMTVILVRIAWVFGTGALARWRGRLAAKRLAEWKQSLPAARPDRGPSWRERNAGRFELMPPFSWQESLVIAWTGMRGVVTLAAAAGIPLLTAAGEPFPGRDLIQAVAYVVTIGTLMLQGLTLPWLIRTLGISAPEEAKARAAATATAEGLARKASVAAITAFRDRQTDANARQVADTMLARMGDGGTSPAGVGADGNGAVIMALAAEIVAARRDAIVKARDDRELDDDVMREMLEQMDLEQAVLENWSPGRFSGR